MFHLRSVSDPPLASPTEPTPWDSRPVTPLAPQPDNADAYAKRPLPPLPPMTNRSVVPPPLNISKGRSKPSALPVGQGLGPAEAETLQMEYYEAGARSVSPGLSPRTPARNSNPPPRMSNLPSPVHSLKHRQSKKVLQLMGHDVDVTNLRGIAAQESEQEPVARASRSFEDPFSPKAANLLQLPDEGLVPVLEDDDGMASLSSKKSSWGPGSPHSASAFPLGHQSSVRRRRSARIFEHDGLGQFTAQDDAYMSPGADADPEEQEYPSDEDMTAGEYHKFAVELAASSVRKASVDEPVSEPKGRRSSIMSFRHGSQFGRLRRRPTTADPNSRRTDSLSSFEVPSQASAAPAEPEEPAEPKSMFEESDSESDRPSSRSRWRRDRFSHRSEERGRDTPASTARREEDSSQKRGFAKSRLLAVGRRRRDQQQAE
ncbi:hypothetical protein J3F83DRAFT_700599 [Trichoderma novae-zelandiae]